MYKFIHTKLKVSYYPGGDMSLPPFWFNATISTTNSPFFDWASTELCEQLVAILLDTLNDLNIKYLSTARLNPNTMVNKLQEIRYRLQSQTESQVIIESNEQVPADKVGLSTHNEIFMDKELYSNVHKLPDVGVVVSYINSDGRCGLPFTYTWVGFENGGMIVTQDESYYNEEDNRD